MKAVAEKVMLGVLMLASACKPPSSTSLPDGRRQANRDVEPRSGERNETAKESAPYGEVSGTAFWLGPVPAYEARRPLHFGDAHPRDWTGAEDADYLALADVVITATRVGESDLATAAGDEADSFPQEPWIECYEPNSCTPVTVVRGNSLVVDNATVALSWTLTRNGHDYQLIEVNAHQGETQVDVHELGPGIYDVVDRASRARVGWVYRTKPNAAAVGPTNGNCRYSIGLEPGRYSIVAWHPYLGTFEQVVEIRAGIISRVNPIFSLKGLGSPKHEEP